MNDYDPKGRYATGDIAIFKGRPWRSLAYHDASEAAIAPDANFRFWDMLPIEHDFGTACQYCPRCNGRTVDAALVCSCCGADYNAQPDTSEALDVRGASSNLFLRFFGKAKAK
jgi:hypothetical protein